VSCFSKQLPYRKTSQTTKEKTSGVLSMMHNTLFADSAELLFMTDPFL